MNKKKIIKLAICGTIALTVGTICILNGDDIIEYGTNIFHKFFPVENVMTTFSNTNVNIDISLIDKLHLIGDPSKCTDMGFLKHIADTEVICNLQKGELFSLIFGENSFTHKTILESDNILSFGCSQMRLATAHVAQDALALKGIILPEPTEVLLRNDHNYLVTLTGRYLELLHGKYSNPNQVWACWNCGEGNFKFANTGYIYKYTINMAKHIAHFGKILS